MTQPPPSSSIAWSHWRYSLLRTLGAGGMGVVFEAQDRLGERVALKCVKPTFQSFQDTGDTPPPALSDFSPQTVRPRSDGENTPTHHADQTKPNPKFQNEAPFHETRTQRVHGRVLMQQERVAGAAGNEDKTVAQHQSKPFEDDATRHAPKHVFEQLLPNPLREHLNNAQETSATSKAIVTAATQASESNEDQTRTPTSQGARSDKSPNILSKERNSSNRSMLYLAREFRLLSSLRHPNIVSVLDYGFDRKRTPFFVMELIDEARDLRAVCKDTVDERAERAGQLVAQIIRALSYLHRRGILHRDLKPGNVLVHKNRVKVLDFGLSILHEKVDEEAPGIEGTLAYMAPELLKGSPPSFASDLYAVGVILYESITEKHPFKYNSFGTLLRSVLHTEPDFTHPLIPQDLRPILQKLLAKTPEERYSDAQIVLHDLNEALSLGLPEETQDERESFLQTARLIGRDAELKTLGTHLHNAIAKRGSMCFLGGESGVGKSRLLEEVRTLALVDGIHVYKGQAIRESVTPYTVWRPILRQLALTASLTDTEASLFKLLVPDLPKLLGRPISDPPMIDIDLNQARLIRTVGDVLRRQHDPILLILEDLQWASEASLSLLSWIDSVLPSLSMLVVVTFRNDEAPNLSKSFPDAVHMTLERLNSQHISSLSQSILGVQGHSPEINTYLERETEGNVFFLIEILRELARSAGSLARIQSLSALPERILPGGVQALLARRLERIPDDLKPLLQIASVMGRKLDLEVLGSLYDQETLERFLLFGQSANILNVEDNQWKFSHDKLRETAQDALSPLEKRGLHTQVVHALEALHSDNLSSISGLLAFHSRHAEDHPRELRYAARAGGDYLSSGSFREAIHALDRVLELSEHPDLSPPQGGWRPLRVEWMRQRAEAFFGLGSFAQATDTISKALSLFDVATPKGRGQRARALVRQLSSHALLQNTPDRILANFAPPSISIEVSRLAILQARVGLHQQDGFTFAYHSILAVNAARRMGHINVHAQGILGFLSALVGLPSLSKSYFERGLSAASEDPRGTTELMLQRAVCYLGQGNFDLSIHTLNEGLRIARSIGYQRLCAQNELVLGCCKTHLGLFDDELQHRSNAVEYYRGNSNHSHVWGSRVGLALTHVKLGQFSRALKTFNKALNIFAAEDRLQRTFLYGGVAVAHMRLGNFAFAFEATRKGLQFTSQVRVLPPACHSAVFGPAETSVACYAVSLHQDTPHDLDRSACLVLAQRALDRLGAFTQRWPFAKPRHLLYTGQLAWLQGSHEEARVLWNDATNTANKLRMPFEEGMAWLELGRSFPAQTPMRVHHIERALEIFQNIQVPYHIELAKTAFDYDAPEGNPVEILRNFKDLSISK